MDHELVSTEMGSHGSVLAGNENDIFICCNLIATSVLASNSIRSQDVVTLSFYQVL